VARPRNSDLLLESLHEQLTRRMFTRLARAGGDLGAAETAIRNGYTDAHSSGATWAALTLLGARFPRSTRDPKGRLEALGVNYGFQFNHSNDGTQANLEAQIGASVTRYTEAMLGAGLRRAGLEARTANYATRWGVQQGIADMASGSRAVGVEGEALELQKTWLRIASRSEKRSWHDALNGVTVPYSALFTVRSPGGTYRVFRPYDAALPLSERIRCGHGIRVDPPPTAARVEVWNGGDITPSAAPERNDGSGALPAFRPSSRSPRGVPVSDFLTVPSTRRHAPARNALELVDRVHGDGDLEPINMTSARMSPDTPGGYATSAGRPHAIIFNTSTRIEVSTALEEIAHMLDHQVLGGRPWASEYADSDLYEVLEVIRATPMVQRTRAFQLGQRVALQRNGRTAYDTITSAAYLEYEKSMTEWFARAYVQYIAVTTGDPVLLREVSSVRSTPTWELLYPRAWQDDEFEPVARALERLLVSKGWMR
jgi:hypothetical protein